MTFRPLRRDEKSLTESETWTILETATHGVISTISSDTGHPYGVYVNHLVLDGKLYLHSAKQGHKIDNIIHNPKCSFVAESESKIDQEGYTTRYRSAVVFGTAKIVDDPILKKRVLYELSKRYVGKFIANFISVIGKSMNKTDVIEITPEHISGKFNPGKYL